MNITALSFQKINFGNSMQQSHFIPPMKNDSFEKTSIPESFFKETREEGKADLKKLGFKQKEIEELTNFADKINEACKANDKKLYLDSLFSIACIAEEYGIKDLDTLKVFIVLDKMLSDCLSEDEMNEFTSNQEFTQSFIKLTQMNKGEIPNLFEAIDAHTIILAANGDEGKLNALSEVHDFILKTYDQEDLYAEWLDIICDFFKDDSNYQKYCRKKNKEEPHIPENTTTLKLGPRYFFEF